jgi:lipopolysaccharide biosynthesis protein
MPTTNKLAVIATFLDESEFNSLEYRSLKLIVNTLHRFGCEVIVGIACSDPTTFNENLLVELNAPFLLRKNLGYDFGTWFDLINWNKVEEADRVIFLNSSIVGPFYNVEPLYRVLFDDKFDFVGVTESLEVRRHFQSFMWSASSHIVYSDWFQRYLEKPLSRNSRLEAIFEKEIPLLETIENYGYRSACLFRAGSLCPPAIDPSIFAWQNLLRSGFPFIKKKIVMQENFNQVFEREFPTLSKPPLIFQDKN